MPLSVRAKIVFAASLGTSIAAGLATHALAQNRLHHEGWDVFSPYDADIATKGYIYDIASAISCGALVLLLGALSNPADLCCRPTDDEISLSSYLLPSVAVQQ